MGMQPLRGCASCRNYGQRRFFEVSMPPGRENHRHPLALQGFLRACRVPFPRGFSCSMGAMHLAPPNLIQAPQRIRDALKRQTNVRSRFQPAAIACAALAGAPLPPERAHRAAYKNAGRQAPPGALRYLYYIKRRVPPQPAQWQAETPSKRPFRDRHSHPHARNRACHPLRGHRR